MSRSTKAVLLVTTAFLLHAFDSLVTKIIRSDLPASEIAFFRFFFGAILLSLLSKFRKERRALLPHKHLSLHLARSLLGVLAVVSAIYSINFLSLADQTALGYLNPLFLTLLGRWYLKEEVPMLRWLAVGFGVCGVILVATPSFSAAFLPVTILLIGRIAAATSDVFVRLLRQRGEESQPIVSFYFLFGAVALGCSLPFIGKVPSSVDFVPLLYLGCSSMLFQLLYSEALGILGTTVVAPFSYTTLVWAALFDYIIWQQSLSIWGVVGSAFVAVDGVCSIVSIYRENRRENQLKQGTTCLPQERKEG